LSVATDQALAAQHAGQANASAEISQSNGFAPPRDCSGSVTLQKQLDDQFDKVGNDKTIAELTEEKLAAALAAGKTTQAEYDKAVKARDQANANYDKLNKDTPTAIIDICKGITSPAAFVSTTISDFLKQHIDQSTQLQANNLPFYATFLSDMATNFLTNILTGGKSTSQVLKEAGTAGLNAALGGLSGQTTGSTTPAGGTTTTGGGPTVTGSASIYALASGSTDQTTTLVAGQTYTIVIDFSDIDTQDFRPYKISVSGGGTAGTFTREMTGAEETARQVKFSYTATATPPVITATFFAKGFTGQPDDQAGPYSTGFGIGQVHGASIILPRGPEVSLR
jgi:hypothetical protein